MIDLGADAYIISNEVARQLGLGREPLPRAVPVDGHWLGTVSHQTRPVNMLLTPTSIGRPVLFMGGWPACELTCLKQIDPLSPPAANLKSHDLAWVPPEYYDLRQVFSKARATSLLPHRTYDCAIDLCPGTNPRGVSSLCQSPNGRPWRSTSVSSSHWMLG